MSTKDILLRLAPDISPEKLNALSAIWTEVTDIIIKKMLELSSPHISNIHIDLREEMTLELAKLTLFTSNQVVTDRLGNRTPEEINEIVERESCFDEQGLSKINITAMNLAQRVWLKIYKERWKHKTEAAVRKNTPPKETSRIPRKVENNHFVPKSFIKRYWSVNTSIFRFTKNIDGTFIKDRPTFGQWGFKRNLYSDVLEDWFGLLEGDAERPLKMLLNIEPLNRLQRASLIGLIVIQKLRNPHFMNIVKEQMKPIVAEIVGNSRENDPEYMRQVYETLFSNNDFYDKLARPIYSNKWVMISSRDANFVLPDTSVIFGMYEDNQYVFMPITPNKCLVILPVTESEVRIVPHNINADKALSQDMTNILINNAENEFLVGKSFKFNPPVSEKSSEIIARVISSLTTAVAEDEF